jgi:Peptidase family M48
LAGSGWYQAVGDIISKHGTPKILPPSDWRYAWVRDTLRTLEAVIPKLGDEKSLEPVWLERGNDDVPLPPPADYPLRPRPRAAEYVRQLMQNNWSAPSHVIAGPPYSLIVVDDPDARNAFSYGFGPDGAGGIVVYSGFLDDILSKAKNAQSMEPNGSGSAVQPAASSFWSSLFGGLFFATPPAQAQYHPTIDQTTDLAILLAHELSHLVLSHHLETLSSMTIFVPGVLSLVSDFIRAFVFPITMLFGPFVNDAFADLGKAGSGELSKLGEYCTSTKQEIEADVVSARWGSFSLPFSSSPQKRRKKKKKKNPPILFVPNSLTIFFHPFALDYSPTLALTHVGQCSSGRTVQRVSKGLSALHPRPLTAPSTANLKANPNVHSR